MQSVWDILNDKIFISYSFSISSPHEVKRICAVFGMKILNYDRIDISCNESEDSCIVVHVDSFSCEIFELHIDNSIMRLGDHKSADGHPFLISH